MEYFVKTNYIFCTSWMSSRYQSNGNGNEPKSLVYFYVDEIIGNYKYIQTQAFHKTI